MALRALFLLAVSGLSVISATACVAPTGADEEWIEDDGADRGDSVGSPTLKGDLRIGTPVVGEIVLRKLGSRVSTRTSTRFLSYTVSDPTLNARDVTIRLKPAAGATNFGLVVKLGTERFLTTAGPDGTHSLAKVVTVRAGTQLVISAQNELTDQGKFELLLDPVETAAQIKYRQTSFVTVNGSDREGRVMFISGDGSTLVISDPGDDDSRAGVFASDEGSDVAAENSGAIRVFDLAAGGRLKAFIKSPNSAPGDRFGSNIAVSRDGSVIAGFSEGEKTVTYGIDGDMDAEVEPVRGQALPVGAAYSYTLGRDGKYEFRQYFKPWDTTRSAVGGLLISPNGKYIGVFDYIYALGTPSTSAQQVLSERLRFVHFSPNSHYVGTMSADRDPQGRRHFNVSRIESDPVATGSLPVPWGPLGFNVAGGEPVIGSSFLLGSADYSTQFGAPVFPSVFHLVRTNPAGTKVGVAASRGFDGLWMLDAGARVPGRIVLEPATSVDQSTYMLASDDFGVLVIQVAREGRKGYIVYTRQ